MGGNDIVSIDTGSYLVTGTPGQETSLQLMIMNKSNDTRKFMYMVNTAYTNGNGQLSYDKSKVTDPSLKIQTASTVSPRKQEITIPGKTNATIAFKLTVPKESFKGTIMGGVTVYPYKEKAKGTVSSNGTLIKNKFSYSIPIQIRQKDAEDEVAKYSIRTVKPGTVTVSNGAKPGVLANIHNSGNSYTGNLDAKAIVTKKDDKSFKVTNTTSNQEIAPTSNYDYQISWGKKSLQAGDYHLKMVYKAPGGLKSWTLNKDFTITNNDAAKYNKLAGIKPNYLWLYILLAILALAIILGLGVYLGKRNNNKNNNMNNNGSNTTRRRRR
ncbi:cell surface protein precursor [Companilactobacillus nantensis DSM 16982]|uniref:Cell surface protein n=2 Tax=Companilactobacillus nantensis TaxID=305793 RepID=A0A0R1WGU8_9LACO|nr:cell surface protein precursor [Companilactobacillus nantensis DSM 16982]